MRRGFLCGYNPLHTASHLKNYSLLLGLQNLPRRFESANDLRFRAVITEKKSF